ncbi:Rossmann-fold NAD(P)-binding domain-containing protein [Streptomyces luteogriseus]|uniref:hypothetical protein n=1 Tax=Streptomyces luteogriseus TaxID=68233 RepID=UPI00380ECE58
MTGRLGLGDRSRSQHLDVTREGDWQRAPAGTARDPGPVPVLADIAGIMDWGTMDEQTSPSFRRVVDISLMGAWPGIDGGIPAVAPAVLTPDDRYAGHL